jgi:hypothetical protein
MQRPTHVVTIRQQPAGVLRKLQPIAAYRRYLRSIAAHDLDAVLACLTPSLRSELMALCRAQDGSAFFELWCETQGADMRIASCVVQGDEAVLDAREGDSYFRISLRLHRGTWLICAEQRI